MRTLARRALPTVLALLAPSFGAAATISMGGSGTLLGTRSLEATLADLQDSFERQSLALVTASGGTGSLSLEVQDELPSATFGVVVISNLEEPPEDEAPPAEPSPPEPDDVTFVIATANAFVVAVPEPGALALLALAGLALARAARGAG